MNARRGIRVTALRCQRNYPVEVAPNTYEHQRRRMAFVAAPISAWREKRPPSNPAEPCGKSAARCGMRATQYPTCQNCDKLSDFIVSCSIGALQHLSGVTAPIAPICVPQESRLGGHNVPARLITAVVAVLFASQALRPPRLRRRGLRLRLRPVPEPCRPERSLRLRTRSSTGTTIWRPPTGTFTGHATETRSAENGAVR